MTKNFYKIAFILCVAYLILMAIGTPHVEVSFPETKSSAGSFNTYSINDNNITAIQTKFGVIYKVYNFKDNTTIWYTTTNNPSIFVMKGEV